MEQLRTETWEQGIKRLLDGKGKYGFITGRNGYFEFWYEYPSGETVMRKSSDYTTADDLVSSLNISQ